MALATGETEIDVGYAGLTRTVQVIVDSTAQLQAIEFANPPTDIPRVGASVVLRVEGVLSDGRRVDVTPAMLGTTWASSDPAVIELSADGVARSKRPGLATITAMHSGYSASIQLEARDGPPEIRLVAPATVTAGSTFTARAAATDDVAVRHVEFLVNGVPATRDDASPYELVVAAPPFGGATLKIAAAAVDLSNNRTLSAEIAIQVSGVPAPSNRTLVYEAPAPGALVVERLPQVLRVRAGSEKADFEIVHFFADDVPIGSSQWPRYEVRGESLVALWEISYTPPAGTAGTTAVLRAEGVDKQRQVVRGDSLIVRVVADTAPMVSISQPVGSAADAVASIPLTVTGVIADDAMTLGVEATLLVDGVGVATQSLYASAMAGSEVGAKAFSLTWVPSSGDVGRVRHVQVQALDIAGNETRAGFEATVRSAVPPQVAVLSPTAHSLVPAGGQLTLTASVVADTREPTQVAWLVDGVEVGNSSVAPFTTTYRVPVERAGRAILVEALARDSNGGEGRSPGITVSVTPDGAPPSLAIVVPKDGVDVAETVDLLVTVAGIDDVAVDRVELLVDGMVFATDTSPAANGSRAGSFISHAVVPSVQLQAAATHRLSARAYDRSGNVGTAPEVVVAVVQDLAPTVAIVRPTDGSSVSVDLFEVEVTAEDDVAVERVELYVEKAEIIGGFRHVGTRFFSPYQFTVYTPGGTEPKVLRAVAIDSGGKTTESRITVRAAEDREAPLLAFQSPLDQAQVYGGQTITVQVGASDNVGVYKVELFVAEMAQAAYVEASRDFYRTFTWPLTIDPALVGSTLTLRVRAEDAFRNAAERVINVRVVEDRPPSVVVTAPAPGSPYREGEDVKLLVTVGDDQGVVGLVGSSGGLRMGTLTSGAPLDIHLAQVLTVPAPIVSQNQPPTVGAVARDTAGHETLAEVPLSVARDTEPPTALLTLPVAPPSARLEVSKDGSLGIRVETSDDVRVRRVALLLDGTELLAAGGADPLSNIEERFEETRVPNPLSPGEIVTSRRYIGVFGGTASLRGVALGAHELWARALDPAGNATDTTRVPVEILPVVDREAPRVVLTLSGTPSSQTCVAGSAVKVGISASDDVAVETVSLDFEGEAVTLPTFLAGRSVVVDASVPMPPLAPLGPRVVSFTAKVGDGAGRVMTASQYCQLVADLPPEVSIVSPSGGSVLTEELPELVQVSVSDDVGLQAIGAVLSTSEVRSADATSLSLAAPAASPNMAAGQVELDLGAAQHFMVRAEAGTLVVTPHASSDLGTQAGQVRLRVSNTTGGAGLIGEASFRYRLAAGHESDASVTGFLRDNPGGRRRLRFLAPVGEADLSFPSTVLVDELTVEIQPEPGGASPAVSRVAIVYKGGVQVRVWAAGEAFAIQRPSNLAAKKPGLPSTVTVSTRLPLGWAPGLARLTAIATDTVGQASSTAQVHPTRSDQTPPTVAITSPDPASRVVENVPFNVVVAATDEVEVETLGVLVNGSTEKQVQRPQGSTSFSLVLGPSSGPVKLTAVARDRAGNAAESAPVFVTVQPDAAPQVTIASIRSPAESATRAEIDSGLVRLSQGTVATLDFAANDDVGLSGVRVRFGNTTLLDQALQGAKTTTASVAFTPPAGPDGSPTILVITAIDGEGQVGTSRLIIEGRRPQPPVLAVVAPQPGATIAEGTIQLAFVAVAGDDLGVSSVDLLINGQLALHLSPSQCPNTRKCGVEIAIDREQLGPDGLPLVLDAAVRQAVALLPPPYNDSTRLRLYEGMVSVPPGFVRLDPARSETLLELVSVATDNQGHRTSIAQRLKVVPDDAPPVVEVLSPSLGADVVEHTPVLVRVRAHDNVLVDTIEILAGPSAGELQVVHVAGGFPPENALPGSSYDIYAPLVSAEVAMPYLASLGGGERAPYLIGVRARDSSQNWNATYLQPIDVVRDREPMAFVVSPSDGSPVVENSLVTVEVAAQDDVAITSVELLVDAVPQPIHLQAPPFAFQVRVPTGALELELQAVAMDSFGHQVFTQVVRLQVVGDRPPTVAVARPRQGDSLPEGRDFAVVLAAQDDVGISSVEASVEGGVSGTMRLAGTSAPYAFTVPLPYGSAGRTLTIRARARDSSGREAIAPSVTVSVVADTAPPTLEFTSPASGSQIVEGLRLEIALNADDNVGVASVKLELNGAMLAVLATAPYRYSYRVPQGASGQDLVFTAKATDTSGNISEAMRRVQVVADEDPGVTMLSPSKLVAGLPSALEALAWDDVAVTQVSFHAGPQVDRPPEIGRRFTLPYQTTFTPDLSLVGKQLTFQARAMDTAGKLTWSDPVRMTVQANQAPSIELTRPLAGTTVFAGGKVRLEAQAFDADDSVDRVVFLVDGARVDTALAPAGIPGAPTTWVGYWTAPVTGGNQTFTLTAVASDTLGAETVSAPVTVGTIRDTVPPKVKWVDPPNGDVVTGGEQFVLSAAAQDNSSIAQVEFYVEGESVGSSATPVIGASSTAEYRVSWLAPTDAPGSARTMRAAGSDTSGNRGESEQVGVELGLNVSPPLYRPLVLESHHHLHALAVRADGLGIAATSDWGSPPVRGAMRLFRVQESGILDLGSLELEWAPVAGAFAGNLALVVTKPASSVEDAQLLVIDVANPSVPVLRGMVDLPGPVPYGIAALDRLAFVAIGDSGLVVVDLSDPAAPQRLSTVPVVGGARGVAISRDRLLVAAGPGGLRVLDLGDPRLGELGFVPVPGEAVALEAEGERAFLACSGAGAELAVVDVSQSSHPVLLSLLSHRPARRDLLASGLVNVAVNGRLVLTTTQLTDQDGIPAKGLLSASVIKPDGTASTFVRANLPEASEVHYGPGWAVASFGPSLAKFAVPKLVVTGITPADGEEQVALESPELVIAVELSDLPAPGTVTESSVTLRAMDPAIGPMVASDLSVVGRRILIAPRGTLRTATDYFISVGDEVATVGGAALSSKLVSTFRTRTANQAVPLVSSVEPAAGPMEGGTLVTVRGTRFAQGARLFFSDAEATQVVVASDGLSLAARTPPQVEGPALVAVLNPDGLQGSLLGGYVFLQVLEAHFVVPATGSVAGGDEVEVSGAGFHNGAEVYFGGRPATHTHVVSIGRIRVQTPRGDYGPADVLVKNPDGKRALAPGAFAYSELVVASRVGRYDPEMDGPIRLAHRLAQGTPGRLALENGRAFVLSRAKVVVDAADIDALFEQSIHAGLGVVDVSTPANASVVGGVSFVPPYDPIDLAVRGRWAFVVANGASLPYVEVMGEDGPSLIVVDTQDQVAPQVVTAVPFPGEAAGIALAGNLALVAAKGGGLVVFSIANPEQPVLLSAIDTMDVSGVSRHVSIRGVFFESGRHALLATDNDSLVIDLAQPGMPVVGQLTYPRIESAALRGTAGIARTVTDVRSLTLAPPTRPRFLGTSSAYVASAAMDLFDLGPQIGVGAGPKECGSVNCPAVLQILSYPGASSIRVLDALDLFPAASLPGTAIDRGVAVATIGVNRRRSVDAASSNDALAVVELPFPMVLGTTPADGATGISLGATIRLELNRPVSDASEATVRLVRLDGSADGVVEPATVTQSEAILFLAPAHALAGRTSYRVVVDPLHAASSTAVMP
ncbi:MAG: IPT/TIG domain-containing protein, partial [Deltaproteobacteria bacterium]|nr:IPT/TIG domain-containing protein [Deltaproteobacteria bacterium]